MQAYSRGRRWAVAGCVRVAVATLSMAALCNSAFAQAQAAQQPYEEYDKRIRSAEQTGPLTSALFGDAVNMYDQTVAFSQTDIDLTGNDALPVQLTRKLAIRPLPVTIAPQTYGGAADWDIDVPYISGVFDSTFGWKTSNGGVTPRCSKLFYPHTEPPNRVDDLWSGFTVNLPGQGARSLIALPPSQYKPDGRQANVWTTSSLDAVSCTATPATDGGEGFVVQTTDGITYTFTVATSRTVGSMGSGSSTSRGRPRVEIYLLASRIDDRFGNSVTFAYNANGHPTSITASDGRAISLRYTGRTLTSAVANGRTWTYTYNGNFLQRITQPDTAYWEITHLSDRRIAYEQWTEDPGINCANVAPLKEQAYNLQMRHPSGAIGTFRFDHQRHYRAGVPSVLCQGEAVPGSTETNSAMRFHLAIPIHFDVYGLTEKTISGPGLSAPLRWDYSGSNTYTGLWSGNVPPCMSCVGGKGVMIVQPDGSSIVESYGTVYARDDGRLLGRRVVAADGTVLENETLSYLSTSEAEAQPFPATYGSLWGGNDPTSIQVRPMNRKVITRDGVTMTWLATAFDSKGRSTTVQRSSSLGHSRTDTTYYYDDTAAWILGQQARIENNDSGLQPARTVYNTLALPVEQYQFGQRVQTLNYNADGTVASFADGRGNVTTLSQWKRGVPQVIDFPDGGRVSAVVDNNGWITGTTNAVGYVTAHGYDKMGRLASTTYAGGDSTAWSSVTQRFEQVNSDEYGIPAGHWRTTYLSGGLQKFTYFDAMWRPLLTHEYDTARKAQTERFQRFSYDSQGREAFKSYPANTANASTGQWNEYDALGRMTSSSTDSELGLLTTVTEYLPGMQVRTTDPKGNTTVTQHQVFDTPNYDSPAVIDHPRTGSNGARTRIARDVFGKPTAIQREAN